MDESLIGSGDFFGILRMDGLDPMLAWGMGATTGHTVVGMRDPITDELFIHESQVNSSYCMCVRLRRRSDRDGRGSRRGVQ